MEMGPLATESRGHLQADLSWRVLQGILVLGLHFSQLGLLVPATQAASCAVGKNRLYKRRVLEPPPQTVLSINKAAYGEARVDGDGQEGRGRVQRESGRRRKEAGQASQ